MTLFKSYKNPKNLIAIVLSLVVFIGKSGAADTAHVEVMHWWAEKSDARAMQVLRDEFEYRGGVWFNVADEDASLVLNTAVSRMAKGYAPSLVQWNSGWELGQLTRLGLLNKLDKQLLGDVKAAYLPSILDVVTVDGEIVAIPVNVHTENWLWYRTDALQRLPSDTFSTWKNFISLASEAEYPEQSLLAISNEPWQLRLLFNSVLFSILQQEKYNRLYLELDANVVDSIEFQRASEIFAALKNHATSFGNGSWRHQLSAVGSGQALATVMGDWARGELRNLRLKVERDMTCQPSPGTQNNVLLSVDSFVPGQVDSNNEILGQKLFLDIVTDTEVIESFNYLKGSLSPLIDADTLSMDSCNRHAYTLLGKSNRAVKPFADIGDRSFLVEIENAISELWSKQSSVPEWRSAFKELFTGEKIRRQSATGSARTSTLSQ